MHPSNSPLKRALEPLLGGLWIVFVIVSLMVGAIWTFDIGDAKLARWVSNRDLLQTLHWLVQQIDFLWISLAAANAYLCLIAREGLGTARRWSAIILLSIVAVIWMSSRTGFPLGPIHYGRMLGARLGPVPLGLIGVGLFWLTAIIGAREGLMRIFPRASHWQIAAGTGVLGLLTDLSLEPLATKLRGFWLWRSGSPDLPPIFDAPPVTCVVWGVVTGLIAFCLRDRTVAATMRPRSWEPVAALMIFHAVFLAAHLGRWSRG